MRFVTDILAKANLVVDGSVTLTTTPNASVDTDRFLVQDGTVVKYRTGAQILSDIGAQGALTLTTTGTSGPATLVGNTLNIPQYQAVLTNPVTGTGILNYVARWTSTSAIGTGILYDDGSVVCVNATSPEYTEKFRVVGGVTFQHAYTQNNALERVGTVSGLTTTTAGGAAYYPGIAYTSIAGYHQNIFNGSVTIPNSVNVGGISSTASLQFNAASVSVSLTQGGSFRAYAAYDGVIAFSSAQTGGSVSHAAVFHAKAPYYIGSNTPTITNYYGLLLNDSTEYSAYVTVTNRWGVYQAGSSDKNHFNGRVLIGTTTDAGYILNVNGDALINGVRVGRGNGSTISNTVLGNNALNSATSGDNVAIGYFALYNNTGGGGNIAIGVNALFSMVVGGGNIAIGKRALEANTAYYNFSIGNESLVFNTSGSYNTAVGHSALAYNTTGNNNTSVGYNSGRAQNPGQYNQTGVNNVYVGYDTRAGGNGNNSNEIVIGSTANGNGSNTATFGNDSIVNTYLKGQLNIATINNATTDTDRFLVSDSGVVKYRTGAEVLSDIGAQAALTNPVTGTGVSGQVAYFNGTTSITGESNLFWDAANDRLGIGTSTPQYSLDSTGVINSNAFGTFLGFSNPVGRTFNYVTSYASGNTINYPGTGTAGFQYNYFANNEFYTTAGGTSNLLIVGFRNQNYIRSTVSTVPFQMLALNNLFIANDANDLGTLGQLYTVFTSFNREATASPLGGNPIAYHFNTQTRLRSGFYTNTRWGNETLQVADTTASQASSITDYDFLLNTTNVGSSSGGPGTITNFYLLRHVTNIGATGTITNRWGLYLTDSTFKSYHAGNLLVGTNTDSGDKVNVAGSVNISTANFFRYDGNTGLVGSGTSITGGTASQLGIRAANEILFATNGANERMRITSTGNVGIGTSSPSAVLHVIGGRIKIQDGSNAGLLINTGGVDRYSVASTGGAFQIFDEVASTNRFYITSGGNVGIGTTSPTGKLMVEATGNHLFLRASTAAAGKYWNFDVTAANQLYIINNAGTQYLTITDGGNVGINEANPVNKLSIKGGNGNQLGLNNSGERFTQISFANNGSQQAAIWYDNTDNDFVIHAAAGKSVVFQTNGSNERMRVNSGGNVLIGTTTDSGFKLDVNGNTYTSGTAILTGGGTERYIGLLGYNSAYSFIRSNVGFSSSYNSMTFLVNFNSTTSTQGNATVPSWIMDLGGNIPNTDAFNISRSPAGSFTFSNLLKLSGAGQLQLNNYTSTSSFPGTAAGFIGFDSSGNLITVASAGGVGGSGTTNYVARWTASTTLGTGVLYDDGTNVGVGTISPDAIFHVAKANAGGVGGQIVIDNPAGSTLGNTAEISFLTDAGASGAGTRNARILAINENVGNGAARMEFHTWNGGTSAARMTILSGGNVGIGTTAPSTHSGGNALVIFGNSGVGSGRSIIELHESSGTGGKAVFQQVGGTTYIGNLAKGSGNGDLILLSNGTGTSATEAVYVKANGNVLVGTSTDLGSNLNVFSTIRVGVPYTSQASIIFGDSGTPYWNVGRPASSGNFRISSYAVNAVDIDAVTGNVGIGTASPFSSLDVSTSSTGAICVGNSSNTISSGDLIGAISFVSRDGSTYSSGGVANIRSYATETYNTSTVGADLRFYTTSGVQNIGANVLFGTERMRITSGGDIASFNEKAFVTYQAGDSSRYGSFYTNANGTILSSWAGAGEPLFLLAPDTTASIRFCVNGNTSSGERMRLNASGNLSIGSTSPDGRLYVERTATWSSGNLVGTNTYQVITYGSGASPGTVTINAIGAYQQSTFTGSATIGNGGRHGAIDSILSIGNTSSGTITLTQSSTIRALSSISAATYYNPTSTTTITHLAGIRVLPDINVGAGAVTVTNKYGILIGDASGGTGSITYTTRWGIYQEGASDNNYFAAKVLIGTTTATSDALYVNGTAYINGNMTVNGTVTELSSANYKRNINTLENTLEKVDKMRAVSYNRVGGIKKEIGLIAEEVEQVYPEFVEYDNNGRPMGLNYARLTAVLLQSIKELNGRINELENRN